MNELTDLGIIRLLNDFQDNNSLFPETLKEYFPESTLNRIKPLISENTDHKLSLYDFHNKRILREEVFNKIKRYLYGKNILFIDNCYQLYLYFKKDPEFNCHYMIVNSKEEAENINKDMKFDVIIGNPPYEGNGHPLYLQILEIVNEVADHVIWICPTQWVKSPIWNKYIENVKNNTCKNIISYKFVGNPFNDAKFSNEVGIFEFGESNEYLNYEDIYFSQFEDPRLTKSIMEKLKNYGKSLADVDIFNVFNLNDYKFVVNASKIRGHFSGSKRCWDWTTLFSEEKRNNFVFEYSKLGHHWKFDSENECRNFIESTESDLLGFGILLSKISTNNNKCVLEYIPYFSDYTHKWTDDMISKELGFTKEEVEYIYLEMKNFGWKAREFLRRG